MKIDSTVQLLHGLELDGVRHCEALVSDLTGHEEALLDAPHMPARGDRPLPAGWRFG